MFSELEVLIQKMEKVPRWFVHFHSVSLWLNLLSLPKNPSLFLFRHLQTF